MSAEIRIVLALAASLAVSACQPREGDRAGAPGGPAAAPPPQPVAIAPQPDAPQFGAFVPPSDGKITPAQVQKYIAVRQRALELAKQGASGAPSVFQLAEVVAAETRAAGELAYNVNEYRWVQARVAEASAPAIPADGGEFLKALEAAAAKGSAQLQKTAETERRLPARTRPDQAVIAHNRGVLDPFRADLAALEKGHPRPGA